MNDTIIVYRKDTGLILFKTVADIMELKAGQHIDEVTFWQAIRNTAEYGIALCRAELAKEKLRGSARGL